MAPALALWTPSASRTLIGVSVVFMVLPTARVRARATPLAEPGLPVHSLGNFFKANRWRVWENQRALVSQFNLVGMAPVSVWGCPAGGTLLLHV